MLKMHTLIGGIVVAAIGSLAVVSLTAKTNCVAESRLVLVWFRVNRFIGSSAGKVFGTGRQAWVSVRGLTAPLAAAHFVQPRLGGSHENPQVSHRPVHCRVYSVSIGGR
jgi:hypothetical protein